MADHVFKMSEVPKGKRFSQFLDYYKFQTLAIIIGIIFIVSITKTIFFTPKADTDILVAGSKYVEDSTWEELKAQIEATERDLNGDGKVLCDMSINIINEAEREKNPQFYTAASQRLVASLAAGDYIIQIVDDEMFDYLCGEGLIATYSDLAGFDIGSAESGDYIKTPLTEIEIFDKQTTDKFLETFYLTLRSRESLRIEKNKKKLETYNSQAAFVAELIGMKKAEGTQSN